VLLGGDAIRLMPVTDRPGVAAAPLGGDLIVPLNQGEGRGNGVPGYGLNGQLKVRAGVEDHLLIVFSVLHFFFFVSFLL
jgi:hypothetical protein